MLKLRKGQFAGLHSMVGTRIPSVEAWAQCCTTIVYPWVQGLCGVPDVPHAADVSVLVTEGSGVGKLKVPPVCLNTIKKELGQTSSQDATILTFQLQVTDNNVVKWETVFWQNKLYAQVPHGILPDGSKEAFISLLEFAEEELNCSTIIICFSKARPDRAHLVRTFMFLGFSILSPGQQLIPAGSSDEMLYLAYTTV